MERIPHSRWTQFVYSSGDGNVALLYGRYDAAQPRTYFMIQYWDQAIGTYPIEPLLEREYEMCFEVQDHYFREPWALSADGLTILASGRLLTKDHPFTLAIIRLLHPPTSPCFADMIGPSGERDGVVDQFDLAFLLENWGDREPPCPPYLGADLNFSCNIDLRDLLALLANWGPCPE